MGVSRRDLYCFGPQILAEVPTVSDLDKWIRRVVLQRYHQLDRMNVCVVKIDRCATEKIRGKPVSKKGKDHRGYGCVLKEMKGPASDEKEGIASLEAIKPPTVLEYEVLMLPQLSEQRY